MTFLSAAIKRFSFPVGCVKPVLVFYFMCPAGGEQDAEPGARLACHLLLRLFKPSLLTSQQSTRPYTTRMVPMVQDACDRQMLAASHCDVGIGPLAAILKAMLILGYSFLLIAISDFLVHTHIYIYNTK